MSEFIVIVWVFEIGSDYVALDGLEFAIYTKLAFNSDLPASVSQSAGSEGEHHFIWYIYQIFRYRPITGKWKGKGHALRHQGQVSP